MKIDKTSKPLPASSVGDKSRVDTGKAKKSPAPSTSDSTSVSLGSTASQLHSMESSMANTPVVDAGKVSEIKQAISDGRFKVNSAVVADKLVESVKSLISNKA